ncbi:MAG: sigma-54-dependent Fis family transcriptional regulator [Syntrophomonadaceae bacterium]|nr:sigma-54-dependent Fis family transcriptional regulator [Syntrophomonadaceae bacterium]
MTEKNLTQDEIKQIWKRYVTGQTSECPGLRKVIFESWERSKKNRVSFQLTHAPMVYEGEMLEKHKNTLREFIDISLPVMENLYKFVADAGFVIVLSDKDGCILEVIGPEEAKETGKIVNFVPGGQWSEDIAGTNSIGTAIVIDQPIQIRGREHYCLMFHPWSCSAAPIHDPNNRIVGTLTIAGPIDKVHPHTLGMVVTAVRAIETQMRLQEALRTLESNNNYKTAVMESISEGILAIDSQGKITHMNNIMARYLGIDPHETGKVFVELLDPKNKDVYDIVHNRHIVTDYEIDIHSRHGRSTYLLTTRPIHGDGVSEGLVLVVSELKRAQRLAQRMSGAEGTLTFSNLIGKNPKFLETVDLARKAAGSISTVLLLGESGTGKEVFAQAIHNGSLRKRGPFVAINCGGIPRELIASELFGYADGAFTGAKRGGKMGKFELAQGGTIFLDEIAEMPLDLQATLLRVLETKTITRVGGNKEIPVDVRIIAATNKDLNEMVSQGKFRHDLFYRLNVFTIKIPPLRERKDDIPLLVFHLIENLCVKLKKEPIVKVDKQVWEAFDNYDWPGNVRELQNVLERVVNVCNDVVLTMEHLPQELLSRKSPPSFDLPVQSYEKELIRSLLEKHNRNITRVARELGIARTTLYSKIAKYGL